MRGYSEDLRQRVIKQWQAGKKLSDLVELFAVSAGSVKRWIRQYREKGDVQGKQGTVWTYRLSPEQYGLFVALVFRNENFTFDPIGFTRIGRHNDDKRRTRDDILLDSRPPALAGHEFGFIHPHAETLILQQGA